MIYVTFILIIFLSIVLERAQSFLLINSLRRTARGAAHVLKAVPEWLQEGASTPQSESSQLMSVRFTNTLLGKDVVIEVEPGANLLAVADGAGVKLPRACRTGLCGSCTCEVQDPDAVVTSSNPRAGYATVRACSVKCFLPTGMEEMVVDVGRLRRTKSSDSSGVGSVAPAVKEDYVSYLHSELHYYLISLCTHYHRFDNDNYCATSLSSQSIGRVIITDVSITSAVFIHHHESMFVVNSQRSLIANSWPDVSTIY
jgi:ferredoxin